MQTPVQATVSEEAPHRKGGGACDAPARDVLSYRAFLDRLKDPRCAPVLSHVKRFMNETLNFIQEGTSSTEGNKKNIRGEVASRLSAFITQVEVEAVKNSAFMSLLTLRVSPMPGSSAPATGRSSPVDAGRSVSPLKDFSEWDNQDESAHVQRVHVTLIEHFERFIVTKLVPLLVSLMTTEVEADAELHWKLVWINVWLQPSHLELPSFVEAVLQQPASQRESGSAPSTTLATEPVVTWGKLIKSQFALLDALRYPKAKLISLLNVCRIVQQVAAKVLAQGRGAPGFSAPLSRTSSEQSSADDWFRPRTLGLSDPRTADDVDGSRTMQHVVTPTLLGSNAGSFSQRTHYPVSVLSADDLLPILIWVTIRACPKTLLMNVEFTALFRHPSLLISEDLYYFTMIASAAEFIRHLKASVDFHITDVLSRQRCLASCPYQNVAAWIGHGWEDVKTGQPDDSAAAAGNGIIARKKAIWDANAPLPTPFTIAAELFTVPVYSRFVLFLRDNACSDAVAVLRDYVNEVNLLSSSSDSGGRAFPELLRASKIHSVISLAVRLLVKQQTLFSWDSLHDHGPEAPIPGTLVAENNECDRFKKKFAGVVLVTESLERFLFSKIYSCLFTRIIKLMQAEDSSKSVLRSVLSRFSFSNERLLPNTGKLGRFFTPAIQGPLSSAATTTVAAAAPASVNSACADTPFSRAVRRLKANCTSPLYDAVVFHPSHKKTIDVVLRRLKRLPEFTNPLEKLKTFTALHRIAETIATARSLSPSPNGDQVIAITALLLMESVPDHLSAHLTFTEIYRHPTLIGAELHETVQLIRLAMTAVELLNSRVEPLSACDHILAGLETTAQEFHRLNKRDTE